MSRYVSRRIAYATLCLALAGFAALAIHTYREVKRELTDVAMARRLAVAQLAAAALSERLDRMVELTVSLATRVRFAELVVAGQWQPAAQILRAVPSQFRLVDRLVLYDARGTLMADVPESPEVRGKNFAYRDWFRGVSSGWQPYVSAVYRRAAAPQKQVFAVAVPIAQSGAEPAGVLQLQVDLESFFDWTRAIDLGSGGSAYVVDAKGSAAFHSTTAVKDQLIDLSSNPAVARLLQGVSGVDVFRAADGTREGVYAFVPARHGWGVVVEQPVGAAFAARENQLRRLLVGYGVILAFFAAVAGLAVHLLKQQRELHGLNLDLEDLYNQAPCGYHSVDKDGLIVRMNDTWLRWLGYARGKVVGRMRHADLMTPESAERYWQDAFPRFKRDGRLDDTEFEYRRKDGTTFAASLNATSIYDRSGRYLMSRSTVFDISTRKRMLEMHAERLRILSEIDRAMVAEQAPEAIAGAVIQPLRQLLGVPRAIVNRFDLAAGEVEWVAAAGRRRTHVGPGVRYSIRLMGDLDGLRRGEPQLIDVDRLPRAPESEALLASGVHVYMAVPMIAGGELLGALSFGGEAAAFTPEQTAIAQEVATQLAIAMRQARLVERVKRHAEELEQRVAERTAELESANRELEDLYNNAPCGYHSVDEEGLFVRMNDTELRWLGYQRDEVIGKLGPRDLHTPESLKVFRERFERFKQSGISTNAEYEFRRKDGSVMPVLLNATAVRDADGRFVMSRSTITDNTERKAAEQALRALNAELESFSYSVSHDLRAPLRAVDGYARMLEEDYAGRLDDEARRLLAVVRASASRMGRLIDDLLEFARLGRQQPVAERVDMARMAREVADELRGSRTVEIEALPPATADAALMRQVWLNLIGNALKYSAKTSGARVIVGAREERQHTTYWVRDNGAGFDMRYADKLFGVFQRLHRADEFEGTGVGLAIVQRVVARHGGRVWAEGKPGEGACFFFSLPTG